MFEPTLLFLSFPFCWRHNFDYLNNTDHFPVPIMSKISFFICLIFSVKTIREDYKLGRYRQIRRFKISRRNQRFRSGIVCFNFRYEAIIKLSVCILIDSFILLQVPICINHKNKAK